MISGSWHCNELPKGEPRVDPIEEEFFVRDAAAEKLMREAIQNSLDARADSGTPVHVRVLSGTVAAGDMPAHAQLMGGLERHLRAARQEAVGGADGALGFLLIEDFGSRGLCGDPAQDRDDDGGGKNDFFWFWRNWARSSKEGASRGRWGVGKTVFPASSAKSAFFGLSRTADGSAHLFGQAVLKVHRLDDRDHSPYVYFGKCIDSFPMPVSDHGSLAKFSAMFGLRRRSESGLSIVIPSALPEAADARMLARAALQHFYFPIVSGDLTVEVQAKGLLFKIDSESIASVASDLIEQPDSKSSFDRTLAMARDAQSVMRDGSARRLPAPARGKEPRWDSLLKEAPGMDDARRSFEAGGLVAFEVPVAVGQRGQPALDAGFHVFMRRDRDGIPPLECYIREGLTIPDIRKLRMSGVTGMVVVQSGPLSTLLGDAENPAHRDWEERSKKVKTKYDLGGSTVRFVKNAIAELVQALGAPERKVDERMLGEYFGVPDPGNGAEPQMRPSRTPQRPGLPTPVVPPAPQPRRFLISKIEGGFRVGAGPSSCVGQTLRIRVAYSVPKGNPFKLYEPADFVLGSSASPVVSSGCQIESVSTNVVIARVLADDFELRFAGFDRNRDLTIDARLLEGAAPSDADDDMGVAQ